MATIRICKTTQLDPKTGGTLLRFTVIDGETRVTNTIDLTKAQVERLMTDIADALACRPLSWKELALVQPTGNPPVIRNPHGNPEQPMCPKQLAKRFLANAQAKHRAKHRPE